MGGIQPWPIEEQIKSALLDRAGGAQATSSPSHSLFRYLPEGRPAASGFSTGNDPSLPMSSRAVRRLRGADHDGVRQMGALVPALTASLSRARKAGKGSPASRLPECRSRTSSGARRRTAEGC